LRGKKEGKKARPRSPEGKTMNSGKQDQEAWKARMTKERPKTKTPEQEIWKVRQEIRLTRPRSFEGKTKKSGHPVPPTGNFEGQQMKQC
jgi:hypothetical protein